MKSKDHKPGRRRKRSVREPSQPPQSFHSVLSLSSVSPPPSSLRDLQPGLQPWTPVPSLRPPPSSATLQRGADNSSRSRGPPQGRGHPSAHTAVATLPARVIQALPDSIQCPTPAFLNAYIPLPAKTVHPFLPPKSCKSGGCRASAYLFCLGCFPPWVFTKA